MVKVSVEVRNGAAHFNVAVRAESIRWAVSIVGGQYPGRDVRVKFPIEPESFFVRAGRASGDGRGRAAREDGCVKGSARCTNL